VLADRIPGARVELFEGAGHLFFWERPDDFVRIVEEFLA
jgi:pimeloyl-ACP methyl ester carboxylesterase